MPPSSSVRPSRSTAACTCAEGFPGILPDSEIEKMRAPDQALPISGFKLRGLRWWIITLIFLATVINYIDRQTINVLAPVLLKDLQLSKVEFGHVTSGFLLAYMLGMGLWGRIVDRIGTRLSF